ncbi:MAG: hypothetical protein ACLPX9_10135 [Rhodomicrobium sp.]
MTLSRTIRPKVGETKLSTMNNLGGGLFQAIIRLEAADEQECHTESG